MKKLSLLSILLSLASVCSAQEDVDYSVDIHLNDGSVISYEVANVDSIVNDNSISMHVYYNDGSFVSYEITNVDSIVHNEVAEEANIINGHEYVDLGLSVKWATCNVEASRDSPTQTGAHYCWGETTTRPYLFYPDECVTYNKSGLEDISGDATYDAARSKWGDPWRMPTKAEVQELIEKCTWESTKRNKVKGFLVTGPNGNSIFLSATGYRKPHGGIYYTYERGFYWTSTAYSIKDGYTAYMLRFNPSSNSIYISQMSRSDYMCPIRPVAD